LERYLIFTSDKNIHKKPVVVDTSLQGGPLVNSGDQLPRATSNPWSVHQYAEPHQPKQQGDASDWKRRDRFEQAEPKTPTLIHLG
jgi:hypothetical protein